MKSKCRPRFRDSTRCHMRSAITMRGVSGTFAAGSSLTMCSARHDNRGRQKGSTQAAYPRLPTSCSSSLEVVSGAASWAVTRAEYFWRLSLPRRHDLETEQKRRPRITRLRAGPRVLSLLKIVDVCWPTAIRVYHVSRLVLRFWHRQRRRRLRSL